MRRMDIVAIATVGVLLGGMLVSARGVARMGADERSGAASLKTITTAEADFRANDRDLNRVNDFWTGDIAGLYAIDNASTGAKNLQAIKLVELSVALADMGPNSGTLSNKNYSKPITDYGKSAARENYWYRMLSEDLQAKADKKNGAYGQDSDETGDLVHHTSRFGAAAMPEKYGDGGKKVFMVNEGNTMFKRDFGKDVLEVTKKLPTLAKEFDANWPADMDLAKQWAKMD